MHFKIINIYALTNSSCCADQISLGWIIVYMVGPMRSSVDPNEILHDRYCDRRTTHKGITSPYKVLTHMRGISKQCKTRSDAAKRGF